MRPAQRRLLAGLLLDAGVEVTTDKLIDRMWGDAPPTHARNTLQAHVSGLRRRIPDVIVSGRDWYRLDLSGHEFDVVTFDSLAGEAMAAFDRVDLDTARDTIGRAFGLWRGDPYPELDDVDAARPERTRLIEQHATLRLLFVDALSQEGRYDEAIAWLQELVADQPFNEAVRGRLAHALYMTGRQVDALRALQEARKVLADLGLEPGPPLRDLESKILLHDPTLDADGSDRADMGGAVNLPGHATSFIGREDEKSQVRKLLERSGLVTIIGVGGSGKTRLATEVASEISTSFPDGVWMLDLADVTESRLVDTAAIGALGLEAVEGMEPRGLIIDHLADKAVLLVVDNCEHLVEGAADLIGSIRESASATKVLATSREVLGVAGEVVYRLLPMDLPEDITDPARARGADSVRLFEERAAAAQPGFEVTADNLADVVRICRGLDGMPLALELAAARIRTFDARQLAAHLDQRFRLLSAPARSTPERQRSLGAVIDWSYRLLTEAEALLFRRLAVFSPDFDFDAAAAICGVEPLAEADMVELLPALVDKSLVVAERSVDGVRYRMLETVRQYALARLEEGGEAAEARRRHGRYFAALDGHATNHNLYGPDAVQWRRRLAAEAGNLRQAMTWALDNREFELALRSLYVFGRVSSERGLWSERVEWYERVMGTVKGEAPEHLWAEAQLGLGTAFHPRADSLPHMEEALATLRRLRSEGAGPEKIRMLPLALNNVSLAYLMGGRAGASNEVYTEMQLEMLEVCRELGEQVFEALALANLAHHRDPHGDPQIARERFVEAEKAALATGSVTRLAGLGSQRAYFEFHQGDYEAACRHWREAVRVAEGIGDHHVLLEARLPLAATEVYLGEPGAIDRYRQAVEAHLSEAHLVEARSYHAELTSMSVVVDDTLGNHDRVATAAGIAAALADDDICVRWDVLGHFERALDRAHQVLGQHRFEELRELGRGMERHQVLDFFRSVDQTRSFPRGR